MKAGGLPQMAAMALVWGALPVWSVAAGRLGCGGSAVALALAAGLMTLSGAEVAFYRRQAFVSHYLHSGGLLFRLLSRRTPMLIWQGTKALVLALLLLIGVPTYALPQWLLLLADVPVLVWLLAALSSLLRGEVQEAYLDPMTRHWAMGINAMLLWFAWVLLMYFSPQENYGSLRWEEVVAFSAAQPAVGCDALAVLARLAAVGEALALWSAQHLFVGLAEPAQVAVAWAAFLAAFGTSLLVAWAYSRALVGMLARPWAVWRSKGDAP